MGQKTQELVVIGELEQRVRAVERITELYRPERMVYLTVTTASLGILLFTAGAMLYRGTYETTELGLMFGSSGLVTYTTAQLLRMWDRAVSIISPESKKQPSRGTEK